MRVHALSWMSVGVFLASLSAAPAEEAIAYRGFTLRGAPSGDSTAFFEVARKGIDMVASLPPRLRALGSLTRDIRYLPVPAAAPGRRADDDITCIYTMASADEAAAYIGCHRNPIYLDAASVAVSLIGNGVYAQRHRDYLDAKRKGDVAKAERLGKIVKKTDIDLTVKAECEVFAAYRDTIKALDLDHRAVEGINRLMYDRNCP